jgi:hypothetical protein
MKPAQTELSHVAINFHSESICVGRSDIAIFKTNECVPHGDDQGNVVHHQMVTCYSNGVIERKLYLPSDTNCSAATPIWTTVFQSGECFLGMMGQCMDYASASEFVFSMSNMTMT